ncbi:hypothetical protein GCM10011578_082400 [Streptomyces fuscichromogenes]|uniref:Uncharacterized protein n=1 Tax=Streptomyces fuscichromogenes TaxID=1324013 RepID=A0A917XLC6_9ACTN|nr:hypothetical protein GCM10011578_082400 [Streptomyces fuscichromogenes]
MAVPGPTMAPAKTGSGTAASPTVRPERGDVTVVMGSLPEVVLRTGRHCVPDGTEQQRMSYEVAVPHGSYQLVV